MQDQDGSQHEVRQGDADQHGRHQRAVQKRVRLQRGQQADADSDGQGQDDGDDGQQRGVRQAALQKRRDRLARVIRDAQVAVRDAP